MVFFCLLSTGSEFHGLFLLDGRKTLMFMKSIWMVNMGMAIKMSTCAGGHVTSEAS